VKTDTKFPYDKFSYRLELKETPIRICWFECEEHLERYIEKHKLKARDYVKETKNVEIVGKKPRRKSKQKGS